MKQAGSALWGDRIRTSRPYLSTMDEALIHRAITALGVGVEEDEVFQTLTLGPDAVSSELAHLAIQAAKLYLSWL